MRRAVDFKADKNNKKKSEMQEVYQGYIQSYLKIALACRWPILTQVDARKKP
jgi:hypothetical protein